MLSRAPLRVPITASAPRVFDTRLSAGILIGILSLAALRRGVRSVDGASLAGLGFSASQRRDPVEAAPVNAPGDRGPHWGQVCC